MGGRMVRLSHAVNQKVAIIAHDGVRSGHSHIAKAALIQRHMPRRSDTSEAASLLKRQHARRLRLLRVAVTASQIDAATAAGVSRFSWNRMEKAETDIDTVALARFCSSYDVPAEYVVSGSLNGLPRDLAEELVRLEAAPEAAEAESSAAPAPAGPSGTSPGRNSRGTQRRKPATA